MRRRQDFASVSLLGEDSDSNSLLRWPRRVTHKQKKKTIKKKKTQIKKRKQIKNKKTQIKEENIKKRKPTFKKESSAKSSLKRK